VYTLQVDQKKV